MSISTNDIVTKNASPKTVFVIDDNPNSFEDIVNRLESVVGVATRDTKGNLKFQLVSLKDGELPYLLYQAQRRVTLPLVIFGIFDELSVDAPPQLVG